MFMSEGGYSEGSGLVGTILGCIFFVYLIFIGFLAIADDLILFMNGIKNNVKRLLS